MWNSRIKLKTGKCSICNDNVDKPLIKGKCNTHYWNAIKAKAPAIPKKSETRIDEDKIYKLIAPIFKRDNCICLANLPGCKKRVTEIHHTKGHDQYYLNIYTFLPVCWFCHKWIEANPIAAKLIFLSQDRNTPGIIKLPFSINYENCELELRRIGAAGF